MSNRVKNFIKNSQGLVALFFAATLFISNPYIISLIWPGTQDPGIIVPGSFFAFLVFTAVVFFFGIFCAWSAYQNDFWIFDDLYNKGSEIFFECSPAVKLLFLVVPFFLLLIWFAFSLCITLVILGGVFSA